MPIEVATRGYVIDQHIGNDTSLNALPWSHVDYNWHVARENRGHVREGIDMCFIGKIEKMRRLTRQFF